MKKNTYVSFTKEMKKDYTILVPNMLPMHFTLLDKVFHNYGLNTELLLSEGQQIKDTGLKYVHNDACYPALLVIGQLIDALQSGKYDPHKVAMMMFQTGGGCRASNYINLIRKALEKAGYDYVPVISFSLAGLEKHPGFHCSLAMLHRMMYAVFYGDLLLMLRNQCRPYEIRKGESDRLAEEWIDRLAKEMDSGKLSYRKIKENYGKIVRDFDRIAREEVRKPRVGIVGEIYVKYSPLANNNLDDFLVREGAEVNAPGLVDFCMYCVYNNMADTRLYGIKKLRYPMVKLAYGFLLQKQKDLIDAVQENSQFEPPTPFDHTVSLVEGYIKVGAKMGEGWLLTAEMLELADKGVRNIVCTQPFGCLPNHICGKGMMKPIKEKNPDINIVAVDYDPGATAVNQENRIKLMLANTK